MRSLAHSWTLFLLSSTDLFMKIATSVINYDAKILLTNDMLNLGCTVQLLRFFLVVKIITVE